MQFDTWTKALAELPIDCVAVGVQDDGELTPEAKSLDLRCREKLSRLMKRGDFTGKAGETWLVTDLEGLGAERVLLVGLGAKNNLTRRAWRRAVIDVHLGGDAHACHHAGAGAAAPRRQGAVG